MSYVTVYIFDREFAHWMHNERCNAYLLRSFENQFEISVPKHHIVNVNGFYVTIDPKATE